MGNFDRNGKRSGGGFSRGGFGGKPKFGGSRFGGNKFGRDRGEREMHQATCSECGVSCEIPFRPNEGRPVFCSNCFAVKKENEGGKFGNNRPSRFGGDSSPRFEKNSGSNNSAEIMEQLKALNNKIDKLIEALTTEIVEENDDTLDLSEDAPVKSSKKATKNVKAKKEKTKTKAKKTPAKKK